MNTTSNLFSRLSTSTVEILDFFFKHSLVLFKPCNTYVHVVSLNVSKSLLHVSTCIHIMCIVTDGSYAQLLTVTNHMYRSFFFPIEICI